MSTKQEDNLLQGSALSFFNQTQETLEDAKRKSASESSVKTQYFQISNDGTYTLRILPLAPVIDADGNVTMPRKGYEYPQKDIFLKINGIDKNGKKVTKSFPVCHTRMAFPNLQNDLIDLYVQLACEANANDKAFCDKITSNSFSGGLKYNSKRCMYVLDMENRNKGLQILQLSFSQYKDLEDAKLRLWGKLAQKTSNAPCPISSFQSAYPIEITRKTENKKVGYNLSIDTFSSADTLTEEDLQTLLDAPRLPEVLYVYRRRHLEATVEFLRQQDEIFGLKIMDSPEIKDCIDQIKMCLPADDQSHFTFGTEEADNKDAGKPNLDELWDRYEDLEKEGLDDRTDEGQELRSMLREFIEDNDLDIRVSRTKTNRQVLDEISDLLDADNTDIDDAEEDSAPVETESQVSEDPMDEPEEDDDDLEPAPAPNPVRHRERNDDTNEPAARIRREPRGVRRRGQ